MTQGLAWSIEGEASLRRQISSLWVFTWTFLIAGVLALAGTRLAFWFAAIAGVLFGLAAFALFSLNEARERLGFEAQMTPAGFRSGSGMLANKPRSTANLTPWFHHPGPYDPREPLLCQCGLRYFWSDAQIIDPNPAPEETEFAGPPGINERYVLLCRCGRGHFKLREAKAQL